MAFCLKLPLVPCIVCVNSEGSGETERICFSVIEPFLINGSNIQFSLWVSCKNYFTQLLLVSSLLPSVSIFNKYPKGQ